MNKLLLRFGVILVFAAVIGCGDDLPVLSDPCDEMVDKICEACGDAAETCIELADRNRSTQANCNKKYAEEVLDELDSLSPSELTDFCQAGEQIDERVGRPESFSGD